ncbi:uncharacterized protein LOC120708699 isoform X1 [Panicum virgatum]|uniref:uncharacterized protein LOC120708699 isoform X1 n=1 Tax=Panicum virgatum TaxID=38727 RepID=UPI0019D59795|nr:uncharacterized protein LOC120708699 isoform X1 [Panicum virgatum]
MALTSLAHWLCTLIEICFGLVGKKAAEKGHVIPKDHLDSKEKELIKIATKGVVRLFIFPMNFPAADDSVVRLFNAVTKAQKPRKDLNPSRTKDAKAAAVAAQTMMVDYCKEVDRADRDDAVCVARGYWGCPSTTELTMLRASGLTSTASATDVEAATGSGYRAIHDWSSMSNAAPCILHTQSISVFSFMC